MKGIVAGVVLMLSCAALAFPRAVPYNASFFEIEDETGRVYHPMFEENLLAGDILGDGWTGKRMGRKVDAGHGRKEYLFENGYLKKILLPGGAEKIVPPPGRMEGTLGELYPSDEEALREVLEDPAQLDIWRKTSRLRFFYDNPNKTAVLFVFLAIFAVWGAFRALGAKKAGKWRYLAAAAAGVVAAAGAWGVFATASRGAFVALALALAAMGLRFVTWRRLAVAAAFAVAAAAIVWFSPMRERFTTGLVKVDSSNSIRVSILQNFPKMIAAAPDGWGLGKSGMAYTVWFQPSREIHPVRTLLNTHFTWLAEMGDFGRLGYLFAYFALAGLFFLRKKPLAVGMIAAMAVAGMFNHVGEEWTLWLAPAAAVAASCRGLRLRSRAAGAVLAISAGAAAGILTGVKSAGGRMLDDGAMRIAKTSRGVEVCGKTPAPGEVFIATDHYAVGGWTFTGKEFRRHYAQNPASPKAVIVENARDMPESCERAVFTGRNAADAVRGAWRGRADSILMFSPACEISEIAAWKGDRRLRASIGELTMLRREAPSGEIPDWVRIVRAAELYIPNWIQTSLTIKR